MTVNTDVVYRSTKLINLWCSKCDDDINVQPGTLIEIRVDYYEEDFTDYTIAMLVPKDNCIHEFTGCDQSLIDQMAPQEFK